jgi:carbon-monoxide dehydrogenase iron sulfur subunit
MIEHEKCNGCMSCYIACMHAHRANKGSLYDLDLTDDVNESRNTIKTATDDTGSYFPLICRHCNDPECVSTCMSGAMTKNPENGLVFYDKDKCASCFMCIMNCPFGILKPDNKTNTFVIKCDFCIHDTEGPNCVRACPTRAIYVGSIEK